MTINMSQSLVFCSYYNITFDVIRYITVSKCIKIEIKFCFMLEKLLLEVKNLKRLLEMSAILKTLVIYDVIKY